MNGKSEMRQGAILSYIAIIFSILSGLIYTPWMVSQIGQSDYGLYTMVNSLITYFTMDFGFGGAISKFITEFRMNHKESMIGKLLGLVYKFYFLVDIVILVAVVIIFLFMNNIFVSLTVEEISKCRVIWLILGCFTLVSFPCSPFNGVLIAYEKFTVLKSCELLNKVLVVILMVIALSTGHGLYSLVFVNCLVTLCLNIYKFINIRGCIHERIDFTYMDNGMLKMVFSFSVWTTVISIADRFMINFAPTILGITAGSIAISIFAIGKTIEGYTYSFANALNSLFLPKVTRMLSQNSSRDELTNLMIRVGRIQLTIVGGIISIFIALGRDFIFLWMGESFSESYYVATLLILPSLITLTQDIGYTLIIASNKVKYRAIPYSIGSAISVVISFVLSKFFGALGAGIGISIATFIGQIFLMNYVFDRKMGLNMKKFYFSCHMKWIHIFFIIVLVGVVLNCVLGIHSWIFFILKCVVLGSLYLVLIWCTFFNDSEKQEIINIVMEILKKVKIIR